MYRQNKIQELIERFEEMKTNPIEFVKKQTFKRSELNVDPRKAKHWADKGLFTKEYDEGAWFIFDFIDAFWLKTIVKLREYNVSLENIKKIRDEFFNTPKTIANEENKQFLIQKIKENEIFSQLNLQSLSDEEIWKSVLKIEMSNFEIILHSILLDRASYFLITNIEGKSLLIKEEIEEKELEKDQAYKTRYNEITSKSHLRIALNEVLIDLVNTLGNEFCLTKIPILTYDEAEILKKVKGKKIKSIELEIEKNSKAEIITLTKENREDHYKLLNEIIISRKYEYIVIHTTDLELLSCSKPF
jgi:DNA-binding transcriptional MerR regulator